jgi:putative thioredoxin
MSTEYIINVSDENFEYEVIAYSQNLPVVVDFWATWCAPCRVLGPLLEKLAREAGGTFRLAKVDVDSNPHLASRFQVRSIPIVKAFVNGNMVSEFTGALPEPRLREFIQRIAPSEDNLFIEKGKSLLLDRQPIEAEKAFRQSLSKDPYNPAGMLGVMRSLLFQGEGEESLEIFKKFPASHEYSSVEKLVPLAEALRKFSSYIPDFDDPLDAAFYNAIRLIKRGNVEAAMDGLLDILRQDKKYKNGEARLVFLGLLELMGEDNPLTRQYRNELSIVLF